MCMTIISKYYNHSRQNLACAYIPKGTTLYIAITHDTLLTEFITASPLHFKCLQQFNI